MSFKINFIQKIIYIAVLFWLLLAGSVYFMPLAFTACSPGSWWCAAAYGLTGSGGVSGFFVLMVLTALFYAGTAPGRKEKIMVFLKSLLALSVFFGALAFVNERYTKHLLKAQRPSHVYMLGQTGRGETIDSLYALAQHERRNYFEMLIRNNPAQFGQIDPVVQQHWIEESGFSFPSGHSFNAFLFAVILAYAIAHNRSRPHLRVLFFLPFIWALLVGVSRVALGAHTALDVSVGAALGVLMGLIFLYIDRTRHWLTRKH